MRVKPFIEGATIRDPVTRQPILDEGSDVPDNTFWVRRFLAGEIWKRCDQAKAEAVDETEVSCLIGGDRWVRRRAAGEVTGGQAEKSPATSASPAPPSATASTAPKE